ncbi:hypothetical protein E4N77_01525 [Treponema denticola]|nr:hypothetical protein E4N77_01525 [Treponema denticola]
MESLFDLQYIQAKTMPKRKYSKKYFKTIKKEDLKAQIYIQYRLIDLISGTENKRNLLPF